MSETSTYISNDSTSLSTPVSDEPKPTKKRRGPVRRFFRRFFQLLLLIIIILAGLFAWGSLPGPDLRVSKETTYITSPLRSDGTPNYAAYLNAKYSQGITLENNAYVTLIEIIGIAPDKFDDRILRTLKTLGLPEDPGKYPSVMVDEERFYELFPKAEEYNEQAEAAFTQKQDEDEEKGIYSYDCYVELLDSDTTEPVSKWTPEKLKYITQWVKMNEKALALFQKAGRKPSYFCPAIPKEENGRLTYAFLPLGISGKIRELSFMAVARMTLRLEKGNLQGAWDDAMACKRLGRLTATNMWLIDYLIGIAVDGIPNRKLHQLLAGDNLTKAQLKNFITEFDSLTPMKNLEHCIGTERFYGLDIAIEGRSNSEAFAYLPFNKNIPGGIEGWYWKRITKTLDINASLQELNLFYDSQDDLFSSSSNLILSKYAERQNRKNTPAADENEKIKKVQNGLLCLFGTSSMKGRYYAHQINPPSNQLALAYTEALMERNNLGNDFLRLVMAARLYQMEKGKYPVSLAELVPAYIPAVPKDPFNPDGGSIQYRLAKDGKSFMLYSFDENMKDDGGAIIETDEDDILDWGITFPPQAKSAGK